MLSSFDFHSNGPMPVVCPGPEGGLDIVVDSFTWAISRVYFPKRTTSHSGQLCSWDSIAVSSTFHVDDALANSSSSRSFRNGREDRVNVERRRNSSAFVIAERRITC